LKLCSIKIEIFQIFSHEKWQILKIQNPVRSLLQAFFCENPWTTQGYLQLVWAEFWISHEFLETCLWIVVQFLIAPNICSRHTVALVSTSILLNISHMLVTSSIGLKSTLSQLLCQPCWTYGKNGLNGGYHKQVSRNPCEISSSANHIFDMTRSQQLLDFVTEYVTLVINFLQQDCSICSFARSIHLSFYFLKILKWICSN